MTESTHTTVPTAGSLIGGRYRLDELAGTGGMAQVWAATDTVLARRVAVKILHPHLRSDEGLLRRFRQEGRLSARLTDPNIVGVFDTVATPDADAIVMELVEGSTLRRLLDESGRLSAELVVDIGCRVADALDVAHRNDLTHRDIKPANILLCADGGVKVADFGIAKTGDLDDLTRDGTLLGTATYLAPEQLRGAPTDGRTDLYSLGVVLYEAVCGRPPFTGDTEAARAIQRLHHIPTPPHRVVPGVPQALSRCIMHALERDPSRRPATAGEFRAELADSLEPTAPQVGLGAGSAAIVRRAPGRRCHARRRTPRRSRLGVAVVFMLIGGSLALIAALLQDEVITGGRPPTTSAATASTSGKLVIPVLDISTFDPAGTGAPGENDDRVGAVIDDDPTTAWRTERYRRRDFATKPGVGLLLELPSTARLQTIELDSPSRGWSAAAYVLDKAPTAAPSTPPASSLDDIKGSASFSLEGRRGRHILVWITGLGEGPPRFHVEIAGVRVIGDP